MAKKIRQARSVLHLLIVLFSLGYVSSTTRVCVTGTCSVRLMIVMAISAFGTLFSLMLALVLMFNVYMMAKLEWIFNLLIVIFWCTVVGMTMFLVEAIPTISAVYSPLAIAFSWVVLTLSILAFGISYFGYDSPHSKMMREAAEEVAQENDEGEAIEEETNITPDESYIPLDDDAGEAEARV